MARPRPPATPRGSGFVARLLVGALLLGSWHALPAHAAKPAPRQASSTARTAAAAAPPKAGKSTPGLKSVSTRQRADNLYRQAAGLLQQGRASQALTVLRQALALLPRHHDSRLALALLLASDGADLASAIEVLRQGLALAPEHRELRLTLARLQLAQHRADLAYQTLSAGRPIHADDAEAQALLAATLQRLGRHQEAVRHYLDSLRGDPDEPRWLIGLGISLQALGQPAQAAQAYGRALEIGALTPEQEAFVRGQLPDPAP